MYIRARGWACPGGRACGSGRPCGEAAGRSGCGRGDVAGRGRAGRRDRLLIARAPDRKTRAGRGWCFCAPARPPAEARPLHPGPSPGGVCERAELGRAGTAPVCAVCAVCLARSRPPTRRLCARATVCLRFSSRVSHVAGGRGHRRRARAAEPAWGNRPPRGRGLRLLSAGAQAHSMTHDA